MISTLIQTGKNAGMIGLDQYLGDLVAADFVTPEEALEKALDKENFKTVVGEAARVKASPPTAGIGVLGGRGPFGNGEDEARAAERRRPLGRDGAAVQRGDLGDEGEAEARTPVLGRERRGRRASEGPRARRPAPSSSTATRARPSGPTPRANDDARLRRFDGVPEEVDESATEERRVDGGGREDAFTFDQGVPASSRAARRRSP